MQKTILLTGATDGIGLATANMLVADGHHVLVHGRNPEKLANVENALLGALGGGLVESYVADLSRLDDVAALAAAVAERHDNLDVLINNAGIYKIPDPTTPSGIDVRFVVNTIAPYLLTHRLLALIGPQGRVVNLSSAAQSPVNADALAGRAMLSDEFEAYAQSKLALTMWSRAMAVGHENGPAFIAVNPGSLLATKMVKEGFGVAGSDIGIGADVLVRAALAEEFAAASGQYFDNDSGRFASPHPDALDDRKSEEVMRVIEGVLADFPA